MIGNHPVKEDGPIEQLEGSIRCKNCNTSRPNNSRYRGRFLRRHQRDNVCENYALKQAERSAMEINASAAKSVEGNDGTRVDMSGDSSLRGEVDGGILQGAAQ